MYMQAVVSFHPNIAQSYGINSILIINYLYGGNNYCTFITITSVEWEMIIGSNYIAPLMKTLIAH